MIFGKGGSNSRFVAACVSNFAMFFAFYMLLPVTVMYLNTQLGAGFAEIGLILSSNMIMGLMVRPFAGYLLDRLHRKRMLLLCFLSYACCFGGYILAPSILCFTLVRMVHGMTFSLTTVTLNTVTIDIISPERRERGLAIFSIMSNLAMATGPLLALYFFNRNHDFQQLFTIAMSSATVGLLLSTIIRYRRLRVPVGKRSEILSLDRFLLRKGLGVGFIIAIVSLSYGMLITFIAKYGNTVSGAVSGAGMFFLYFSSGMVVSRIAMAGLIGRGYLKILSIVGLLTLIISYTIFIRHANPTVYYASGIAMGVVYGMLAPALQNMIYNLAEHRERGTANATYLVSWDFGVGVGVLLGGVITQARSLSYAFTVANELLVVALILFVLAVAPHYSRNKKEKIKEV